MKKYYSIKEIADFFGVSYNAIRQEMTQGLLNYSKVGGSYRIKYEDLKEYEDKINAKNVTTR